MVARGACGPARRDAFRMGPLLARYRNFLESTYVGESIWLAFLLHWLLMKLVTDAHFFVKCGTKTGITDATRGRRIAWRSISGLTNRGYVLFVDAPEREATQEKSSVTLAIEFDVPGPLAKVFDNNFIGRFVRETLLGDLKRFRAAVLRRKRQQRVNGQCGTNV